MGFDVSWYPSEGGKMQKCSRCGGTGKIDCHACDQPRPCVTCAGTKKVNVETSGPRSLRMVLDKRYEWSGWSDVYTLASHGDYLRGLVDAGVDGAKQLLDDLEKHGELFIQSTM